MALPVACSTMNNLSAAPDNSARTQSALLTIAKKGGVFGGVRGEIALALSHLLRFISATAAFWLCPGSKWPARHALAQLVLLFVLMAVPTGLFSLPQMAYNSPAVGLLDRWFLVLWLGLPAGTALGLATSNMLHRLWRSRKDLLGGGNFLPTLWFFDELAPRDPRENIPLFTGRRACLAKTVFLAGLSFLAIFTCSAPFWGTFVVIQLLLLTAMDTLLGSLLHKGRERVETGVALGILLSRTGENSWQESSAPSQTMEDLKRELELHQ